METHVGQPAGFYFPFENGYRGKGTGYVSREKEKAVGDHLSYSRRRGVVIIRSPKQRGEAGA